MLFLKTLESQLYRVRRSANSVNYLRFSVANSIENIEKALDRIDGWVNKNL